MQAGARTLRVLPGRMFQSISLKYSFRAFSHSGDLTLGGLIITVRQLLLRNISKGLTSPRQVR